MQKMIIESWAKPGMSREAFIDYLEKVHGPLVRQHRGVLGFRKYIQNHRVASPEIEGFASGRGWADASDSSVELWLDDAEVMISGAVSEASRRASAILEDDERGFVDPARMSAFLAHEEIIFDYIPPGARLVRGSRYVKMVVQAWRRADTDTEAFQKRWRVEHGDLVRRLAKPMGFVRYVQSHRIRSPGVENFATQRGWRQAPDGLAELWWESTEAMQTIFTTEACAEASAELASDEVEFIDPTRLTVFLAREHVVFDDTARSSNTA